MFHGPTRTNLFFLQILASLLAGFFVFYSITDSDIYWHLASGREMLARKAFLFADPFSFTTPLDRLWINLHWVFQIIMYAASVAGGSAGVLIVKSVAVAAATWLLVSSFPRTPATVTAAFLFASIIFGQRYLIPLRPIIVTLLAIGAFIAALERYSQSGKLRFILLLVATQIVWVNSQGLFMIGPALAAAYAIGEYLNVHASEWFPRTFLYQAPAPRRKIGALFLLPFVLTAVSLINPYGFRVLTFSFSLFQRIAPVSSNIYSTMIAENRPLFSSSSIASTCYPLIFCGTVLLLVVACITARRYVRFSHLGCAIMGGILAVMAERNGVLFTFCAFPAILHALSSPEFTGKRFLKWPLPYVVILVIALGTIISFIGHVTFLRRWPHTVSPFSHPIETAEYIEENPFAGNIFNADRYGGYLAWKQYPECKVSHDTRLTLRTDEFFHEYRSIISEPSSFDEYAARWNISRVALPLAPVTLYLPLAKYLYRHPNWKLVYTDGSEAFFAFDSPNPADGAINLNSCTTVDSLVGSLRRRYFSSPPIYQEALYSLSRWCTFVESFAGAERALGYCSGPQATLLLAGIKQQQGLPRDAEEILVAYTKDNPRDKTMRMNLIRFYLHNGKSGKALSQLSLLLKKYPFYRPARKLLFTLSRQ